MNDASPAYAAFLLPALLIWLAALSGLGMLFNTPRTPPETPPIDAQLIELPAPAPVTNVPAKPSIARHQTSPIKKSPPAKTQPQAVVPQPVTTVVPSASPAPMEAPKTPTVSSPTPAQPETQQSAGTVEMGARAIYQPKPVIPEELRGITTHAVVTARFHIATDGQATVTLLHASPEPQLNQVILNTLKSWRFFPATQGGKPVDSMQDIEITVDISS